MEAELNYEKIVADIEAGMSDQKRKGYEKSYYVSVGPGAADFWKNRVLASPAIIDTARKITGILPREENGYPEKLHDIYEALQTRFNSSQKSVEGGIIGVELSKRDIDYLMVAGKAWIEDFNKRPGFSQANQIPEDHVRELKSAFKKAKAESGDNMRSKVMKLFRRNK